MEDHVYKIIQLAGSSPDSIEGAIQNAVRAKNGSLPPYSVWLGNVILAIAGLWILRRILRY